MPTHPKKRQLSPKLSLVSSASLFSLAILAAAFFLVLGPKTSQALQMRYQPQVLDAATYQSFSLTSATNTSLSLTLTPQTYDPATNLWTYQIYWKRTLN